MFFGARDFFIYGRDREKDRYEETGHKFALSKNIFVFYTHTLSSKALLQYFNERHMSPVPYEDLMLRKSVLHSYMANARHRSMSS